MRTRRSNIACVIMVFLSVALVHPAEWPRCWSAESSGKSTIPVWDSDTWAADAVAGQPSKSQLVGSAHFAECGPTGAHFKGLPEKNLAIKLSRAGDHIRLADDQEHGPLDFGNGDAITLEAWVRIDNIKQGAQVYIIGKGRTYETQRSENHNYALRLSGDKGNAKASFLFSTHKKDGATLQYHRWTSKDGFAADGDWHHVAVSYRFGEPQSIAGYIDGRRTKGSWDMGGATSLPPVNDNDAVWIGSSRGGDPGNSLVGELDAVQIHRQLIDAQTLASRREPIELVPAWPSTADEHLVTVCLFEGAGSTTNFPHHTPPEAFRFTTPALALHRLPLKYATGGLRDSWQGPVMMRAFVRSALPAGESELLIRSPGLARLWIDGKIVQQTPPRRLFANAHQPFEVYQPDLPWLRVPHVGDHEVRFKFTSSAATHEIVLESLIGSSSSRCEPGETLVAVRTGDAMFTLLAPAAKSAVQSDSQFEGLIHLVDEEFLHYRDQLEQHLSRIDRHSLEEESAKEDQFWDARHRLAQQYLASLEELDVPAPSQTLAENNLVDRLSTSGLTSDEQTQLAELEQSTNDLEFLRRVSLDTVGVPPSLREIEQYLSLDAAERREQAIARLLLDERWADHWVSYWQDVLAENPNILKPKLNNTGPFRWWLYDALVLNKPMDRFATELIRMEGSAYAGGPAGFGWATENDVPMAEKAHIIAGAFLSVDMKCARCHDAPYHPWSQRDLFSIAAMLENKPIKVPDTSSVPTAFFDRTGSDSPIAVTLQPGELVQPRWPSETFDVQVFGGPQVAVETLGRPQSSREELAALMTRAENSRFAATLVNRVWTRLMGWGLVEDTDDWYEADVRNPALLEFLSRELINSGYDLKHVTRLVLQSRTYQRRAIDETQIDTALVYTAPWQHRLSAEQVVDSMHQVAGVAMDTETITFDPEASQKIENFLNLGEASRAWQLTSLSNERDRPSLSLPKAATIVECLEAFGWRQSRQSPLTHRNYEANMVQPGVVANGTLTGFVSRLTEESATTQLALDCQTVEEFVEQLFLSALTRSPSQREQAAFAAQLNNGFANRIQTPPKTQKSPPISRGFATWTNHFAVEANALMRDIELEVAAGPEPTARLSTAWRERAEDALWALVNAPEFQLVP